MIRDEDYISQHVYFSMLTAEQHIMMIDTHRGNRTKRQLFGPSFKIPVYDITLTSYL